MKFPRTRLKSAVAFSLVEVALALGIASFCLVTVIGLIPVGVSTGQVASDQTTASSIITQVLADLRATPATSPPGATATSKEYSIVIPASAAPASTTPIVLYFGTTVQQFAVSQVKANSRFRLTINFFPAPGITTTGSRRATDVTLLVTWPATIDPNNISTGTPTGRVQVFAALDRN